MGRIDQVLSVDNTTTGTEILSAGQDPLAVWDYDFEVDEQTFKFYRQGRVAHWTVDDLGLDGHELPEVWVPIDRSIDRVPSSSVFASFDDETWKEWRHQILRYMLSQCLHGEHLGLLSGAALVETSDSWDVKLFAATQTADEARHFEAFAQYLQLMGGPYPVSGHLHALLDDAIERQEWDMVYLALQMMVESLGLGAFSSLLEEVADEKLRQLLRNVLTDEARHVAFGVHLFRETLQDCTDKEVADRIDFVAEATRAIADMLVPVSVIEHFGLDRRQTTKEILVSPTYRLNRARAMRHITPVCARLGLFDLQGGRLRRAFEDMGMFDKVTTQPTRKTLAAGH